AVAGGREGDARRVVRRPPRLRPLVPGGRRPGADARLGRHGRPRAHVPPRPLVALHHAGARDLRRRPRLQPARRRPPRRPRRLGLKSPEAGGGGVSDWTTKRVHGPLDGMCQVPRLSLRAGLVALAGVLALTLAGCEQKGPPAFARPPAPVTVATTVAR